MKKRLLTTCVLMAIYGQTSMALAATPMLQETDFNDDYLDEDFGDDQFGDFYGSDEFISIATGTQKSVSKAPSVATVITSDQIKKFGVNNIHEVIETVTGIHVYPSKLNRMNASYSIRGIHTSQNPQVLVLINGDPIRANYTGAKWDLFNIGTELVERVEVIRGPGSAVHGADAFSGVINIITKGADTELSVNDFGLKAGSFGTKTGWLNYNIPFSDSTSLLINAQWQDTDGDDSRIIYTDAMYALGLGSLSKAPGELSTNLETTDLHLTFKSGDFYLSAWYLENNGGTGAGAAQALAPEDISLHESFTLKTGYKFQLSNNLSADLWASWQDYEGDTTFTIFPAGMALPRAFDPVTGAPTAFTVFTNGVIGRPIQQDQNLSLEGALYYTGKENHNFRVSIGHLTKEFKAKEFKNFGPLALDFTEEFRDGSLTDVSGTDFVYMPNVDRDVSYISIQDEWKLAKDWELTAGLRYDDYSDFGSTVNPRLALVWQTKHNLTAKALYGKAFRAPSFDELYAINNPVILGNSSLDPEKINTYEIAFDYRPNFDWKLLLSIFSYKAENLIIYTPIDAGTNRASNAAEQDGNGVELEAHWKVNSTLNLKMGYSYQNSKDADSDEDIADAPQNTLDFTVDWDISDAFTLHADSRWINNRSRQVNDLRPKIDNYSWTNLNIIYHFSDSIDTSFSIRNLFNEDAREASDGQVVEDYPLEERGYWLKVAASF